MTLPNTPAHPRLVTASRLPIFLALVFAALKWFAIAGFGRFSREWVLAPWWLALYAVAAFNHQSLLGRTLLSRAAWPAPWFTAALTFLRQFGLEPLQLPWWAILSPLWTLGVLYWLSSLGARIGTRDYGLAGGFWLAWAVAAVCTWREISIAANWSWPWMAVVFALVWGALSLYNVVRLGGARYLWPGYLILVTTVPLVVSRALTVTAFDLTWLLILLPALVYSGFCGGIVLPRIRDLRRRLSRRNAYTSERAKTGQMPAPVTLEKKMAAMPLPGSNKRFRFVPLAVLLITSLPLNVILGVLVGRLVFWIASLIAGWHRLIEGAVILFILYFCYYLVYIPAAWAIAWVARRCDSGHRPTLWTVALAASLTGFTSLSGTLLWAGGGTIGDLIPTLRDLGLAAALPLIILYLPFAAQAGTFGLMKIFSPTEWKPPSPITDTSPANSPALPER